MALLIFKIILLTLLVVTAVAVLFLKNPMTSVVVFMSYSSIMAIVWILLESPDLAITEAAVGAGITSVLFFLTLKKIHQIDSSLNTVEKKDGKKDDGGEGPHEKA